MAKNNYNDMSSDLSEFDFVVKWQEPEPKENKESTKEKLLKIHEIDPKTNCQDKQPSNNEQSELSATGSQSYENEMILELLKVEKQKLLVHSYSQPAISTASSKFDEDLVRELVNFEKQSVRNNNDPVINSSEADNNDMVALLAKFENKSDARNIFSQTNYGCSRNLQTEANKTSKRCLEESSQETSQNPARKIIKPAQSNENVTLDEVLAILKDDEPASTRKFIFRKSK